MTAWPVTGPVVDVRDAFCLHAVPDGAVAALRGLTLAVAPGERVVVHGPNGSGKTTLLRVLAGEQRLSAGRAVVAGLEVGRVDRVGQVDRVDRAGRVDRVAHWRATRLGWIDQHPARTLRPELDVLGNVALQQRLAGVPAGQARATALAMLDRLGVADLASRRPGTLSGGQAQRVAVCAALAHGPRLVLADEPTGELDTASALAVYDALAAAVRDAGAALVLVSHDRAAARIADRVVRIRDGRLSETRQMSGPELLVVDDRGWLWLPAAMRSAIGLRPGAGDAVRARLSSTEPDGEIVLSAEQPAPRTASASPAPQPSAAQGETAVLAELRGVTKAYGGRTVLAAVDADVRVGRLLVVQGPSGVGKSTLLRVLLGLERPDSGTVQVAGTDLAGLDRDGLAALRRSHVAVVGQDVHLAETVDPVGNLQLARIARGLPEDHALVMATLESLRLESLVGRDLRRLSGGERQRVAVARALVVQPDLAVVDEPTSQLDEATAETLVTLLVERARLGMAVVVATHDPLVIDAADQVLRLG